MRASRDIVGETCFDRGGKADELKVNQNGTIISNVGIYHALFGKTMKNSSSKYVAAWGGIQSAGRSLEWAMYTFWFMLVIMSVPSCLRPSASKSRWFESITTHWWQWLVAKLFSGLGVGMLQAPYRSTMPKTAPPSFEDFLSTHTLCELPSCTASQL